MSSIAPEGTAQTATPQTEPPRIQTRVVAVALALLALLAAAAFSARGGFAVPGEGLRYAAGALLGAVAGIGLYHAAFGFTAAWRRLVRERRGAGLRAQMLLIAGACLITYPLIGFEQTTGWDMHPVILPLSLASAIGAFVFGIGMQLGGGCASGTLFTVGGGSTRMVVTLAAFIAGSVWATAHIPAFWAELNQMTGVPTIPGFSAVGRLGPIGALALLGVIVAAVWLLSTLIERRTHGDVVPIGASGGSALTPARRLLSGPWSLAAGALVLAGVSVGCFLLFQRPGA
ncbi:MAG: YeeE/YedE thiosulfate transporter family protein [Pseudomonadota bacterium]